MQTTTRAPIAVDDLGPLQVQIMTTLWKLGEASVQEVLKQFPAEHAPAYVTILTVLRRLEKRGFVSHEKSERKFIYRPLIAREVLQASVVVDLADRYFSSREELSRTMDRVLALA